MNVDFDSLFDELRPQPAPLEALTPLGLLSGQALPWLVDGEDALVVMPASPQYLLRLPVLVGTSVTLLEAGGSGLDVCEINLVNLTGSPVTCKLFHSEGAPVDDSMVFGLAGGTVPANGSFQWQGVLSLAVSGVYAQAGAANAIVALVTVRLGAGMVRA